MNEIKKIKRKNISNKEPKWFDFIDKNDICEEIVRAENLIDNGDKGRSLNEVFDDIDRKVFNV